MIISEKLRHRLSGHREQLSFDGLYLSRLIIASKWNTDTFRLATVQNITDFLFQTTSQIMQFMFYLYLFGFMLPFIVTIFYEYDDYPHLYNFMIRFCAVT
jgi:hypothetical protein